MLITHNQLLAKPVMSLQTGAEIARVKTILLDPRNLVVIGYELEGKMLDEHPSFLRVDEIREFGTLGFIVDSSDDFVGLEDVIKVREVYDFHFELIGLDVIEQTGTKLGKVHGYTVDPSAYAVQQLIVRRPLLKSFTDTELTIHRSQIVEVSDTKVVVRSAAHKDEIPVSQAIRSYANPFRQPGSAQPDTIGRPEDNQL